MAAALTPEHVSSLSDTAVLDVLREAEIRRRQAKALARNIITEENAKIDAMRQLQTTP